MMQDYFGEGGMFPSLWQGTPSYGIQPEGEYYNPDEMLIGKIHSDGDYVILRHNENGEYDSKPCIHYYHKDDYL